MFPSFQMSVIADTDQVCACPGAALRLPGINAVTPYRCASLAPLAAGERAAAPTGEGTWLLEPLRRGRAGPGPHAARPEPVSLPPPPTVLRNILIANVSV